MAKTAAALHILVKEEQLALDLLEQIKNGADFGKLAKKHSICPSGKRGGDLGEFRQGQMVPAFDKGVLMIAMVKAGVELAFETMVASGIIEESAYYESLHELPLIANTIARKRLYEMNVVISDTAEYGNYLFSYACVPLLKEFMTTLQTGDLGTAIAEGAVDNAQLRDVNEAIRSHAIEQVGKKLRGYMTDMKRIAVAG